MSVPLHATVSQLGVADDLDAGVPPRSDAYAVRSATAGLVAAGATSPAGLVGATPVLWIDDPLAGSGKGFWAKLEGQNPGGIKDRAALYLVGRARQRGELAPGAPIVESTSGTFGLGLALAGLIYGHPVTLVSDDELEPLLRRLLAAYGARVEIVTDPHPRGGWQQARLDRVSALLEDHPGAWWPDQYSNPDNLGAYAGLAAELITQLGRVDVLVCSVGTGGHSGGIARVLRTCNPDLRLVGVDAVGSTIFGQPPQRRLMRGLGSSIHPRNVAYELFDEVHWVAASEAAWTCRRLAGSRYATGGWSVGAVALVAAWLARTLPGMPRIVAVFPDGPHRYWDTIYNDAYCTTHGLLNQPPAPDPDQLDQPAARAVTRWSRCTTIVDPLVDPLTLAGTEAASASASAPASAGARAGGGA